MFRRQPKRAATSCSDTLKGPSSTAVETSLEWVLEVDGGDAAMLTKQTNQQSGERKLTDFGFQ